jgi:hypothetical protein
MVKIPWIPKTLPISSWFGYNSTVGLGTKDRQKRVAEVCKRHLREKYRDLGELVEEFILEFEGSGKDCDITRWGQFTDIRGIDKEMLERLDAHFQKWLNP